MLHRACYRKPSRPRAGIAIPPSIFNPTRTHGLLGHGSPVHFHYRHRLYSSNTEPQRAQTAWRAPWRWIGLAAAAAAAAAGLGVNRSQASSRAGYESTHVFAPYTLVDRTILAPTLSILTLDPANRHTITPPQRNHPIPDGIHSIDIAHPQLTIYRSYTPLPTTETLSFTDARTTRILVRHAAGGELSRYLHSLAVGAKVSLRGPRLEYSLPLSPQDAPADILFIAGGTGIAPALQVAALAKKNSRIAILWASRSRQECQGAPVEPKSRPWWRWQPWGAARVQAPVQDNGAEPNDIVRALETFRLGPSPSSSPSSEVDPVHTITTAGRHLTTVRYFIDSEGSFIDKAALQDALHHFDSTATFKPDTTLRFRNIPNANFTDDYTKNDDNHNSNEENKQDDKDTVHREETPKRKKKIILVSGPEGFVASIAGRKRFETGRGADAQGPLGGLLADLAVDRLGWEVWKL
ncbi:MAG: hypothetical protein M1825_004160 [Sarcosagium campestre]|nr:MAG: hypothetical protein M1825_004160 [Sarcosagium campestre]